MLPGKRSSIFTSLFLFLTLISYAATAPAEPPKLITPVPGMEFIYIPPGDFVMGSPEDEDGREDSETRHRVTLSRGFYMQAHEVTVDQWSAFIKDTAYKSTADETGCMVLKEGEWEVRKGYNWKNPGFSQEGNHPVTCVSWKDAQAFSEWVSGKAEGTFRLPTEAEWEYACRAGTATRFFWGDKADCEKANFGNSWTNECGRKEPLRTVKTGSYPPNPWGLHDMHGNAWEWTHDWFADYPQGPVIDPTGPEWGERRAVRGGSWWSYSRFCRSAARVRNNPDQAFQTLGFRLVRTP